MRAGGPLACVLTGLVGLGLTACAAFTIGREFPSPTRESIRNRATTKADLERTFGKPVEVGHDDGDETWTWFYATKGDTDMTKNLKVRFDREGKVLSYSFSSSFPEDTKALR